MAQFSMEESDNYGSSGSSSFFTLKNDMDKARVRFLYRDMADVKGDAVHKIQVGDKERYVNCLRAYNEPVEKCPLCESKKYPVQARLFVKLFNLDANETQIWERGKKFFPILSDLCSHHNPLCNEVIEITRHGKAGDTNTTYTTYPLENSEFDLESVECSEPLGTIILDKTADEMNVWLQTGNFPANGSAPSNNNSGNNGVMGRRTPSTMNNNTIRDDMPF